MRSTNVRSVFVFQQQPSRCLHLREQVSEVDSKEKAQEIVVRIDRVKNIRNELIYLESATGPAP